MDMEYVNNSYIIKERLTIAHNKDIAKIRNEFFNAENNFFKEHITNSLVLVAGSGLGQESIELSKYNKKVIGVDIIPEFIYYSLEKTKNINNLHFMIGDITILKFSDNFFDVSIFNMGTIGDFENKKEILAELLRVSKKVYFDFYFKSKEALEIRKKMYSEEGWKNVEIKDFACISSDGLYSKSYSKGFFEEIAKKLDAKITFYILNKFSVMACLEN